MKPAKHIIVNHIIDACAHVVIALPTRAEKFPYYASLLSMLVPLEFVVRELKFLLSLLMLHGKLLKLGLEICMLSQSLGGFFNLFPVLLRFSLESMFDRRGKMGRKRET